MNPRDLSRKDLIDVAEGFGIYEWKGYEDLLSQVERWPCGRSRILPKPRGARELAGDIITLTLLAVWAVYTAAGSAVVCAGMKLANKIEGVK